MTEDRHPVNPDNNSAPAGKSTIHPRSPQATGNTQSFTNGELPRRIGDVTAHHASSTHARTAAAPSRSFRNRRSHPDARETVRPLGVSNNFPLFAWAQLAHHL